MSASPTKEASPAKTEKVFFTEKEERVLKAAWQCLKTPPEIDIEKLKDAAGFNTTKTASNTWSVIKKKLATYAGGEGGDSSLTTPKSKDNATRKKRGKKATVEDDDEDHADTPSKKRKTPKKTAKAANDDELVNEEAVKAEDE